MGEDTTHHVDVLIIGAGISGIGAAHHLMEQCPGKTFAILERQAGHGGTWATHTYPGIRSDSDLYTFGYRFKPWAGAPIAKAELILDYMADVISENAMADHIHYGTEVVAASWSTPDATWTVSTRDVETGEARSFTCNFLYMCQGYYDHQNPYTPEWPGMNDFQGQIVHPQIWPEDLDYSGKKVVVIGSGATAVTLIPAMAEACAEMTMLQRSPGYFFLGENRNALAERMRADNANEEDVHASVRAEVLAMGQMMQNLARENPDMMKEEYLKPIRAVVGDEMVAQHFTPRYRPWQQRITYVPEGDLFKSINAGHTRVVTDEIETFTATGLKLKSGKEIEADIIVTATGFNLLYAGGIAFTVDDAAVDFGKRFTYRGLMVSGVPNMALMFGYFRTSWTMRVDLVADYVGRLLNHMDETGTRFVVPSLNEAEQAMPPSPWVEDENMNSGYIKRGQDQFPKNGTHAPWRYELDYYTEKDLIPAYSLEEPELRYG